MIGNIFKVIGLSILSISPFHNGVGDSVGLKEAVGPFGGLYFDTATYDTEGYLSNKFHLFHFYESDADWYDMARTDVLFSLTFDITIALEDPNSNFITYRENTGSNIHYMRPVLEGFAYDLPVNHYGFSIGFLSSGSRVRCYFAVKSPLSYSINDTTYLNNNVFLRLANFNGNWTYYFGGIYTNNFQKGTTSENDGSIYSYFNLSKCNDFYYGGFIAYDFTFINTAVADFNFSDIDFYIFSENDSYNDGYVKGFEDGYSSGESVGKADGYQSGYTKGYQDGIVITDYGSLGKLFGVVADTPVLFIKSLFNFDLFGMNVFVAIMSLLSGLIVLYIIKKVI